MGDGGRSSHVIESFLIPSPPLADCSLGSHLLNNKRNETHTSKFRSNTTSGEASCKAEDDSNGDSFSKVIHETPAQQEAAISDLEFLSTCRLRRTESSSVFNFSALELARVNDSKSFCLGTEIHQNIEEEASNDAHPVACNENENLDVVQTVTSNKPSKPRKENEPNKFQHTSFDSPQTKRECALKPCPSLDSSLSPLRSLTEIQLSNLDHQPSSSPYLEPGSCFHPSPRTPSTPASVVASQASLDSGVLSAHSFDLSQSVGLDVSSRRRRTGSSISSGISEVWQTSFDGEMSVTMEAVSEAPNIAKPLSHAQPGLSSTTTTTTSPASKPSSVQNDCSSSFVSSIHSFKAGSPNVEDSVTDFSRNEKCVGAPPSAHIPVDHSYVLPETRLKIHDVPLSVIFPVASEDDPVDSPVTSIDNEMSEASLLEASPNTNNISVKGLQICPTHPNTIVSTTESIYSSEMRHKIEKFALNLVMMALNEAFQQSVSLGWSIKCSGQCNQELCREDYKKRNISKEGREREPEKSLFSTIALSSCSSSLCWTPELPFSPSHRSFSRTSKRSSLSFSHDSLVGGVACQDDSHLIKGAVSHEVLAFPGEKESKKPKGPCAICLESDIYSLPVDMVKPYQGPILQPKVIVQQPKKRYLNRSMRLNREKETGMATSSKRNFHTSKKKGTKHGSHRNKDSSATSGDSSGVKATTAQSSTSNGDPRPLPGEEVKANGAVSGDGFSRESDRTLDAYKTRQRREVKCSDQGKLCRIIPFTSSKPHKRKDITDAKGDRKKGRSLSSNIRNTLVTFFSFKRTHKEHGSCVNAKNEFIDASSQGFFESSDGLKWGKICPLPSAPPLRSSMKYSAFTDHVGSGTVSSALKQSSHHKRETLGTETKTNQSNANGNQNHQRQSNSISPASLLACLGHPRTNSIDEQDRRPRLPSETPKQSAVPPASNKTPSAVVTKRALPPLPPPLRSGEASEDDPRSRWKPHSHDKLDEGCDFASIIEKVKNYGWYWGPISGEAAEKVLSNEPDGSFIVRDSSDYHYIFSLTFRLNGVTRHVRIEHDQGNFSFGGFTRFKSQTIVDFIEKAVEHSRSGRYLFFLHRRPVLGPMRVQLLHPVSRFKHVQSLQHLCRFVIVKQVRKDLIHDLPLPQRLKDYLSSPHYYSEQVEQCMTPSSALSLDGATASPESRRLRSPCLRHTQSRRQARLNPDPSEVVDSNPGPSVRVCSGSSSVPGASRNGLSTSRRYNFNEPGTSVTGSRRNRSRDLRLSSSHSSLENCLLQTYPVSPSTLSSESNSGHPNNAKLFRKKSAPFFSGSSHSSPSSPVPFDYSPPDWLSSSEDLFQFQSSKVPFAFTRPLCNNSLKPDFQMDDNFYRLTFDKGRLKTNPRPQKSEGSASPIPQSVTDALVIDKSRSVFDKESLHSTNGTVKGKCPFESSSEKSDQSRIAPDPNGK